jgi:nicotinamide mononucleotide transporter
MIEIFQQISAIQWFATLFSLIYIAFAVKNNPICWVFGIIGCGLWAYADFTELNLKFDGILQIFYVIMGFVGLYLWKYGDNGNELAIQRLNLFQHGLILVLGFALSFLLGFIGENYLDTDLAYLDSITTSFSIIATILLVKRVLGNWIYWIVFDVIYIYIYIKQEGYLFAIIMGIYIVMAIIGYYSWRKEIARLSIQ